MVDDDLLMVSIDGGVYRIDDGRQEAERIGQVAIPSGGTVASVRPTSDGERRLVDRRRRRSRPSSTSRAARSSRPRSRRRSRSTCRGPSGRACPSAVTRRIHSIVALETGDQIADLSGVDVTGTSASDGCTVIGARGDLIEVVTADGTVPLGRVTAATLAPDGRTVVRTTGPAPPSWCDSTTISSSVNPSTSPRSLRGIRSSCSSTRRDDRERRRGPVGIGGRRPTSRAARTCSDGRQEHSLASLTSVGASSWSLTGTTTVPIARDGVDQRFSDGITAHDLHCRSPAVVDGQVGSF